MCHGVSGPFGLGMFASCCGTESPCLLVPEIDGGGGEEAIRISLRVPGFSWFVLKLLFHFSPMDAKCPKFFAILTTDLL